MCFLCASPTDPAARFDTHPGGLSPTDVFGANTPSDMAAGSGAMRAAYTWDQIADYLTAGYWATGGTAPRAFVLGEGRTLEVDLTALSPEARMIAGRALEIWAEVSGITFTQTPQAALTVVTEGADLADGTATTLTITQDTSLRGTLTPGDRDAVRITLAAGQTYALSLDAGASGGISDPYLRVLNGSGAQVAFNDDGGPGLSSFLSFTPSVSGTYYLVAGSYGDEGSGSYVMAARAGAGGGGADITFASNDPAGAYAFSQLSGRTIISSTINIPDTWSAMSMNGYMLQTYVHEIGHALGLGHAGPYNGAARYGVDNVYENDSWLASVMSYFDQRENTAVSGDLAFLATVMPADIIAIQALYGFGGAAQAGNTVWGPGGTLGNALQITLDMAAGLIPADPLYYRNAPLAFTIFDTGGTDTLDVSAFGMDQEILLTELHYSNIGGLIDNVVIARGTRIEGAMGGAGNDTIIGNALTNTLIGGGGADSIDGGAGNDTLDGGMGNDTLMGGAGNDWIEPGAGANTAHGGDGVDMVSFLGAEARAVIDLAAGSAVISGLTTILRTIEDVTGTGFGDLITGDAGANRIRAMGDYDWMIGSGGGDLFDGGTGRDTVAYTAAASGVVASLASGRGSQGQATGDRYAGVENLTGSSFGDTLTGNEDHNILRGLGGDDFLFGGGGRDLLEGGGGHDTLSGGLGNDRLSGGRGNDRLDGGVGWDTALFSGMRAQYTLDARGDGSTWVGHNAGGIDGFDILINIEVAQFSDGQMFL